MFKTNLKQVMDNLQAMQSPATWGDIARKAFDVYGGDFPDVAAEALREAMPELDSEAISAFVESFVAQHQYPVMRFMLGGGRGVTSPGPLKPGDITAEDIENWVRVGAATGSRDDTQGKVFDERDLDVDDVVEKMQGVLLYGSNEGTRALARDKYLPFIAAFVQNTKAVDVAGSAILAAWVKHIRRTWPEICRAHLQAMAT